MLRFNSCFAIYVLFFGYISHFKIKHLQHHAKQKFTKIVKSIPSILCIDTFLKL